MRIAGEAVPGTHGAGCAVEARRRAQNRSWRSSSVSSTAPIPVSPHHLTTTRPSTSGPVLAQLGLAQFPSKPRRVCCRWPRREGSTGLSGPPGRFDAKQTFVEVFHRPLGEDTAKLRATPAIGPNTHDTSKKSRQAGSGWERCRPHPEKPS